MMNADGSGQTRLTTSDGVDRYPAWSPDGTKITFVSRRNGVAEVYAMNPDGSGQTKLPYQGLPPPPYKKAYGIIYAREQLSPDGTKIARREDYSEGYGADIWVAWVSDTTGWSYRWRGRFPGLGKIRPEELLDGDRTGWKHLAKCMRDCFMSWSPDGAKIAFMKTGRDWNIDIQVINADGTGQTQLTNDPAVDRYPSWSPFIR